MGLACFILAVGACSSSSSGSEGGMNSDASADACEASSPRCPLFGSVSACTYAQAEQGICGQIAAGCAGHGEPTCWASSCTGGFNTVTCINTDQVYTYYYDPSGAIIAEVDGNTSSSGTSYFGPCSFNAAALVCTAPYTFDAGCACGDGQALDGGSPDSSAD